MFYVYILYSEKAEKYYIGFTSILEGRVEAHNHHANKGWTKPYQPWKLVHSESFELKKAAMVRERKLKSYKNKEIIKMIIQS